MNPDKPTKNISILLTDEELRLITVSVENIHGDLLKKIPGFEPSVAAILQERADNLQMLLERLTGICKIQKIDL